MIDNGNDNGLFFIIITLVGMDLKKFKNGKSNKALIKIAGQCLEAIEDLHKLNFIHSDIKENDTKRYHRAENLAMGRIGTEFEGAVHLLDFGSCLKINEVAEEFAGTPLYASVAAMESKMLGFKDDLESWFYMLIEWIKFNLPWRGKVYKEILELKKELRDDKLSTFKEVFGEVDAKKAKEDTFFIDFAKILRYIDSLKREDTPDYDRIHYFLQCAFEKISKETGTSDDDDDETLVKKLNEFSRAPYRHLEYKNVSLNFSFNSPEKGNLTTFKCYGITGKPCGLKAKVYVTGSEKLWDSALIESVENEECCEKLNKSFNKDQADIELKPGVQLGSWKVLSGIDAKGLFKVSNIKTTDSQEYSLKASKLNENEKSVILKLKISKGQLDKLCHIYDDGNCLGHDYFVLTSLGPTLEELLVDAIEHKFSLATTYSIGIQCVDALEQLHSIGFMHNQICSKAFAIKDGDPRSVVLYDFQHASEIVEHAAEPLNDEDLTKPFKSCVVSPPDDLESLLYLMILWIDGVLPWSNIQNKRLAMHMKLKVETTEEIRYLLDTVPFSDTIDYSGTKKVLFDGLNKRNLQTAHYDWEPS
uniref:Protein kinase domain-containing protein n=1 Tax=Panagrolaimus davidi TaxID=227884 RepID=A0A914Q5I2_9BILA